MNYKAILIGVNLTNDIDEFKELLEECKNLANACDIEVVDTVYQNLPKLDSNTCLKKGKIDEVLQLMNDDIDCIIVYNNLSSRQISNLNTIFNVEIFDRTTLILEIFARRARSKLSKIETELAKLQYELPRLMNAKENYDQQKGGSNVTNRGMGEKKIEINRRTIKQRISKLQRELKDIKKQSLVNAEIRNKSNLYKVCLVGYTNAGKSSLMNALVKENKKVYEENQLFATLDTSVRKVNFNNGVEFLLYDTIGFVSNLPHELIDAFDSTLESMLEADLLIHVMDGSHYNEYHREITIDTLNRINAQDIKMINVYTKADLINEEILEDGLYISSKTGYNIDKLLDIIYEESKNGQYNIRCLIPYNELNILKVYENKIEFKIIDNVLDGQIIEIKCNENIYNCLKKYIIA